MKYMGSKRTMLQNGLGTLLRAALPRHDRFVDLFCGAGSVSWFAATESTTPVLSVDLQQYATTLASSVVNRTFPIKTDNYLKNWIALSRRQAQAHRRFRRAHELDNSGLNIATWCKRAREFCNECDAEDGMILASYGGHYFSPTQAVVFDSLIKSLPTNGKARLACLASTIVAASRCAAAPGHTAQPFQPTRSAGAFLREAWSRDPIQYATRAFEQICPLFAKTAGTSLTADANAVAETLNKGDLVFVDPPYSGVHYSRFYHVLETIARGHCGMVSGTGRYPPPHERPVSSFSRKGESAATMGQLLERLASSKCTVILTFPQKLCSNGLSGRGIVDFAQRWFHVEDFGIQSRFSTLGGNNSNRKARKRSHELILLMRPKSSPSQSSRLKRTALG